MDYICYRRKLGEVEVRKFIRQTVSAVHYLHQGGILHRYGRNTHLQTSGNKQPKRIVTRFDLHGKQKRARSIRPKFPEILVQNRMEEKVSGNSFRKFRSTSRGCPFFWKFGNSENFQFHLAFLPGMNQPTFTREKLQDGGESFESTVGWMQRSATDRACS